MTDRPTDLSPLPPFKPARRSGVTARKFALMASVVAGLGVAVYGFSPSTDKADLFTSPAHAQVNNDVSKVAQPIGFADIVERVKPSVISVKVRIKDKANASDEEFAVPAGFADGTVLPPLWRAGWPAAGNAWPAWPRRRDGAGLRLLHFG